MHRVLTLTVGAATTAEIRTEQLAGRTYTVVPVIALVEGVLQGANSTQPELAPASEFGKYPDSWNGRPVVLNHPQVNGVFVSANHPQVFEDYSMGFMFNTILEDKKLKTEAWLDNARIAELGGEYQATLDRIVDGDIIDVSVGVFLDTRAKTGTYKGRDYQAQWENVVPDHLAILPNQKGACSVADGCGTNRVAQALFSNGHGVTANLNVLAAHPEIRLVAPPSCCDACAKGESCMPGQPQANAEQGQATPTPTPTPTAPPNPTPTNPPGSVPPPSPTPTTETPGHGEPANEPGDPLPAAATSGEPTTPETVAAFLELGEQRLGVLQGLATAALGTQVELMDAMRLVRDALPGHLNVERWAVDLMAMTADKAVFYAYGEPDLKGFNQISYSVSDNGAVTFAGDPEPVNLMTRIMPRQTGEVNANSGSTNSEKDGAMPGQSGQGGENQNPAATAGAGGTQETGNPAPAQPAVNAAPTLDEYLASVPADLRGVLSEGIQLRNQRKESLIKGIKANSRNRFTDEQLAGFEIPQLEAIAALADAPTFEGRALGEGDSLSVHGGQPAPVSTFMEVNENYLAETPAAGNA